MVKKKKAIRKNGRRLNADARRFLHACAREVGSVEALARKIQRPADTLWRLLRSGDVRDATADDQLVILRRLGFVGVTGLEPVTLQMAPATTDEPTPSEAT